MNDQIDSTETGQEEPSRPERQGKGLVKIDNFPFKTRDRAEERPEIIDTRPAHQREPRRTYFRSVQVVNAEHQKLLAQAAEVQAKAREIERHYEGLERRLDSINHVSGLKEKELNNLRQRLAGLDPAELKSRFEIAFSKLDNFHGSPEVMNEWLIASSLRANAKELRALLAEKIEEGEREIATMAAEKADIEKQLSDAGAETV